MGGVGWGLGSRAASCRVVSQNPVVRRSADRGGSVVVVRDPTGRQSRC